MAYAVKELFYTLQGEGAQTGRAAVFLRFTGCNLWTGLEKDRDRGQGGCSRWCDTDFVGMDGQGGGRFSTAEALASAVQEAWRPGPDGGTPLVVCTGGEPLLQLDAPLVAALRTRGFAIAVETNGTQEAPAGLDWICVSPKAGGHLVLRAGNELKLIFPQKGLSPDDVKGLAFTHFFLQPMDGPDKLRNMQLAVEYCLAHPKWRLSLQTHKFLGIP